MSSGIFAPSPQIQIWPPRWPPQTAAARNAPDSFTECQLCIHGESKNMPRDIRS